MSIINKDKLVYKINCWYLFFKCERVIWSFFCFKWYTNWKFNTNVLGI